MDAERRPDAREVPVHVCLGLSAADRERLTRFRQRHELQHCDGFDRATAERLVFMRWGVDRGLVSEAES